jgi:hypothetical protein
MKYSLKNASDIKEFNKEVDYLLLKGAEVELKHLKNTRTLQQNKSLHLFFTMITEELNELGMEYIYFGLKGQELSLMYTPELVKMFFWKPIQVALFDIESTTKLTTDQMNKIIDVIVKFFGDKGVIIDFPSMDNKEI